MGANVNDDGEIEYTLDAVAGGDGGGNAQGGIADSNVEHRLIQLEQQMQHVLTNLFPNDATTAVPDGYVVRLALSKTSGSDGNATAVPSYTYSGTFAGTVYTGLVPVTRAALAGRYAEATDGIGVFAAGSLTLIYAIEKERKQTC